MTNPYASPYQFDANQSPPQIGAPGDPGFVRQIKPLGVCMTVQGGLECLLGIMLVILATFFPAMMQFTQNNPGGGPTPAEMANMSLFVMLYYGVSGGLCLVVGLLRIIAGISALQYRFRPLVVVSHFAGVLTLPACYCLPTAIAICVWGCIVCFNPAVKCAFNMRSEGKTVSEIDNAFRPNYPSQ